ncbi:MAG: TonB-dependent receptor [Dysgonomonas sp.]|nr:TonB-dependent receptor [Dysgonomonas sp.]
MKKIILPLLLILLPFIYLKPQSGEEKTPVGLKEVTVTARRTLSDIGVQKTELDSTSLRESLANSLADVLSQNSTIFIKSYGRATLSTASFRGTAPSHTQVTWNDIALNSPMLGMVDFSLIPSYFIDDANIYHGASSTGVIGGGLGGAITLGTKAIQEEGLNLKYIQGISSFDTYDEFFRVAYGSDKWKSSTRFLYSSSDNDFKYTNIKKEVYLLDQNGNRVQDENGDYVFYHPKERNKNGSFKDMHLLQELYYNTKKGDKFGVYAWYMNSKRGVPMLNSSYRDEEQAKNEQKEQTLRTGASWDRVRDNLKLSGKGGYTYTDMTYTYKGDFDESYTDGEMIHSQSYVNTAFGKANIEYFLNNKWLFISNLSLNQHFVNSRDQAIKTVEENDSIVGYNKKRTEISGFLSIKYTPTNRLGIALNLRDDFYGTDITPIIPAAFVDYLISKQGNIVAKASIAKNYRYPTLNDLYFVPGGNPDLKTEKGYTYDGGVEFTVKKNRLDFLGEVTAYNSYIKDWILWLPTYKGFWSPVNVKKVHSYGLEVKGKASVRINSDWKLELDGNYAITRSINQGEPKNWADEAIGKQLVYIPEYSSALTGRLYYKSWLLSYKWNYYSERFTTSSNEKETKIGLLTPYYMNDISLEKQLSFKWAYCSLKLTVNNLFNEEYESVLSRPMAGRNFGFFIGITPRI